MDLITTDYNAELNRFNQKFKACVETAAFMADDKKFKKKHSFSMTEYISKGKSLLFKNSPLNFHVHKYTLKVRRT